MSIQRFLPSPTTKHSFAIAVGDRRILLRKTNGGLTRNLLLPPLQNLFFGGRDRWGLRVLFPSFFGEYNSKMEVGKDAPTPKRKNNRL